MRVINKVPLANPIGHFIPSLNGLIKIKLKDFDLRIILSEWARICQ